MIGSARLLTSRRGRNMSRSANNSVNSDAQLRCGPLGGGYVGRSATAFPCLIGLLWVDLRRSWLTSELLRWFGPGGLSPAIRSRSSVKPIGPMKAELSHLQPAVSTTAVPVIGRSTGSVAYFQYGSSENSDRMAARRVINTLTFTTWSAFQGTP